MLSPYRTPTQGQAAAIAANGSSGRELASAESTTVQTGITAVTDITGLTITFTVGTRPVLVRAYLPFAFQGAAAAGAVHAHITDAANVVKSSSGFSCEALSQGIPLVVEERISTPGTYTRKVRLDSTAGGSASNGATSVYISSISATEK